MPRKSGDFRTFWAKLQRDLIQYDFNVHVDGRQLFKPVDLHDNTHGYTTAPIGPFDQSVYGKTLKFHGYFCAQEGLSIRPDELRGVIIRLKNIAIGYYDPSFLDYRINEGPRSRWVTGEIYVDQGLENALNIDRDSFNRFHPEFKAMQEYIHNTLQGTLFSVMYKNITKRSTDRNNVKQQNRQDKLVSILENNLHKKVEIAKFESVNRQILPERNATSNISPAQDILPPKIDYEEDRSDIVITLPPFETLRTSRQHQQLASSVIAIFEVALQEKTDDSRRSKFESLLLSLLKGW